MRYFQILTLIAAWLLIGNKTMNAQTPPMSAQIIEGILSASDSQNELTRLKVGITTLLADHRLTHQPTRQMLTESQAVLTEMQDQKVGANAWKLIDFAKWMRAQAGEKYSIHDTITEPTEQQQFILDNPLAGQEVDLTSILHGVLGTYLEIDRDNAGQAKLEALLQLYLNFRPVLERSWWLADNFLLYAPQWTQSRYPQLTADQKIQFLKDVNDARQEKAIGPGADEEPAPTPTQQEQIAYEAAYQFIVNNTPQ